MAKECCGTCKWHRADENFKEDYICCNGDSEYCSDWTEYEHCCDEWEGRVV